MNDDFESLVEEILKTNIEATKNYVRSLNEKEIEYLYLKPIFVNLTVEDYGEDREIALDHLSYFVAIANILHSLSPTNIIEVGCGPGWLSEYLARLGFDVTGVDVSEDLIKIAEKRKISIPYSEDLKLRYMLADAHARNNKAEKYDCVILYGTLHHLDEPDKVVKNIYNLLTSKGFMIINEGERPPKGLEGEKKLINAMKTCGWLERPFFKEELVNMLKRAGFKYIEKLFSGIIYGQQSKVELLGKVIVQRLSREDRVNFFIAFKDMPELSFFNTNPYHLSATIKPVSLPELHKNIFKEKILSFRFRLENKGEISWACSPNLMVGYVTFAALVSNSEREVIIDKRVRLDRIVRAGEYIDVGITIDITPLKAGRYRLSFDLVCEQINRFSKFGTEPYEIFFDVE